VVLVGVGSTAPKRVTLESFIFEHAADDVVFFGSRSGSSFCCLLLDESLVDELSCWRGVIPVA